MGRTVSFYNYKSMHEFLRKDIDTEMDELLSLDSDPELISYQQKNEKVIGKFLGKGFALGTSSGTAALQLSLAALGIGEGDEVITVPNTYVATALAISAVGAIPKFIDVHPDSLLIDETQIEDAISEKTKAILPVHLYGLMSDMKKISRIAKKNSLSVVEDACHAHLAEFSGKRPGRYSDSACYSFYPSKAIGGLGSGGMILSSSRKLSKKLDILREPRTDDDLLLKSGRTPASLDWTEMAFIKARMKYSTDWTEVRRRIARQYQEELENLPIGMQIEEKNAYHVYRCFTILTEKRDKLKRFLEKKGIDTCIHYPVPLHLKKMYSSLGYQDKDLPVCEAACENILSLPINPFLSEEDVSYVSDKIKEFFTRECSR